MDKVHATFVSRIYQDRVVLQVSRDATAIEAREKAAKKPTPEPNPARKKGRPKKGEKKVEEPQTRLEKQGDMSLTEMLADLPKACDTGCKANSKGFMTSWKGYKLHIDTADGDIPIAVVLTSASVHDSQVSMPLSRLSEQRVEHCYELMDSAYDAAIIREDAKDRGVVALIDFNRRSPKDERKFEDFQEVRYNQRSSAERVNGNLKDNFGGRVVRVKGHAKVLLHLMFGILALTVTQALHLCASP
jgi:hypothetical protein